MTILENNNSSLGKVNLAELSEEQLLNRRICDLDLKIEGTWLEECIRQLYQELNQKGIKFKPLCYLADEWLTPENETVIGIPFYLADAMLMKLEKKMMLDVEGGTNAWCMQLLRHEAGHALTYAYRLNKKKKWQELFGRSTVEYPETYRYHPYSKNYVRHLEGYYAQFHPDEDFVETFAIWLTPDLDWEAKYKGWRALDKLRYVDQLMKEIQNKDPFVKNSKKLWHVPTLRITLRNFYKKRRHFWAEDFPDFHDIDLKRIFIEKNEQITTFVSAEEILRKYKEDILKSVSICTGEKKYIISSLLKTIDKRCSELKLICGYPESVTVLKLTAYLTTLIMNYIYTGWFRGRKVKKVKI